MNEKKPLNRNIRARRYRVVKIWKEQNGICIYCKKKMWLPYEPDNIFKNTAQRGKRKNRATMEHLYPVARGGSRKKRNNQALSCYTCNHKKRDIPHSIYIWIHRFDRLYKLALLYRKVYHKTKNGVYKRNIMRLFK